MKDSDDNNKGRDLEFLVNNSVDGELKKVAVERVKQKGRNFAKYFIVGVEDIIEQSGPMILNSLKRLKLEVKANSSWGEENYVDAHRALFDYFKDIKIEQFDNTIARKYIDFAHLYYEIYISMNPKLETEFM
ncbi:MAG: hypothetical protein ACOC2U_01940, partial [bacterium]